MTKFTSELSGSLLFSSASSQTILQPYSGGLNVSGSDLYINGVALNERIASIEAGNVGSASLQPLNSHSSSVNIFTGSIDSRVTSLEAKTGSLKSDIDSLTAVTSSYLTTSSGAFTSSAQISSSGFLTSESAANLGFGGDTTPAGTISSSQQIEDFGFITSSVGDVSSDTFNSFTSSIQTQVDSLTSSTSSYITDATTGSLSVATASYAINALTASYALSASYEIVNEVSSSHAVQADSASYVDPTYISASAAAADFSFGGTFDGNRIVTNPYMGDMFSASFNAGTSGSVHEFLEKIFFTNTAPEFNFTASAYFNVGEFNDSGSAILQLTGTDTQNDSFTFSTSSAYTDDLVRIAPDGTVTLNVIPTYGTFNTVDRGDGTLAHEVEVVITDVFGAERSDTIYITVSLNTAPVFRQTSDVGSIISSFNANRNENATTGEVTKIYFTDGESDAITIRTGSDANGHFSMSLHSNYVRIYQTTVSLDYETITAYSMSITASDEHYEAAQDTGSISTIFVGVTVTDNLQPTINPQTLAGVNENSGNGASAGTVTGTADNEGDTITFNRFVLDSLSVEGSPVPTGSYGGGGQLLDPHEDPFTINSSTGEVTRKTGVYLNSDLIDTYIYRAFVRDAYNETSSSALITIPIADDVAPSLTGVQQFYAIESALAGDNVYDSTNGFSGTIADFNSNQAVTWYVEPTADFSVNSSGNLLLNRNISGSGDIAGTVLTGSITASNAFLTETAATFSVIVTQNAAPDITFTDTTGNQNTNLARSGSTLVTLTFSDTEGDTIDYAGVTFEGTGSQLNAIQSGNSWLLQAKENLSASTYTYSASVDDEHSFRTNTENDSFTIAAASIGTLGGDTTSYIIESAVSGAVLRDATGFGAGNASQLTVSYSPNYGSATVQSFTSSNAAIEVDNSGNITLAVNLSGSATGSGDTINTDITFRDQYDNVGSGSVTVNVFANIAPTGTFTDQTANFTASISTDTYLVGVTISDTESDTPFSMSLSGVSGSLLKAVPQNANSSSYQIQAASNINAGTVAYSASIFDNFGKQTNYNRSFNVAGVPAQYYIYLDENGTYATSEANALTMYGDSDDDGTTDANTTFAAFVGGNLGDSVITTTAYTGLGLDKVFLIGSGSTLQGSNTSALVNDVNHTTGSQGQTGMHIVFPSGSANFTQVDSMTNTIGGSTPGQYLLYADRIGTGITDAVQSAFVRYFQFTGGNTYPVSGEAGFGVIFTQNDSTSDINYFLMASSGSAPSSTQ